MQQNHPHWYTRPITIYLRIQYKLWHVLYAARKLRNTPFYWYPTQVFSINSTKDIAVFGLGLVWWGWFWKTLYIWSTTCFLIASELSPIFSVRPIHPHWPIYHQLISRPFLFKIYSQICQLCLDINLFNINKCLCILHHVKLIKVC